MLKKRFPTLLGKSALAMAAALTVGAWLNPALAGPPDVQVKSVKRGTATFDRSGSTLNIRVSDRAIIDYARFNLGKDSTVRFIQPSASSRVLNRIESRTPSTINGRLQSNGIVYFLNPSGVLFGPNAVIDVGRIYAVGGRISDNDFLQNNNRFQTTGPVVNQGQITGGEVYLVGRVVTNNGTIFAPQGSVAMLAGDEVIIGPQNGHLFVKIDSKTTGSVENNGTIKAPGGAVSIGAGDMYSLAMRRNSNVTAKQVTVQGGKGSDVQVSGTIDASDVSHGRVGGNVAILGDHISLDGANIDASGDAGGGVVLVGGNARGLGPQPNASEVSVSDSFISADAISLGNGGKIVVWSDYATEFSSTLRARGGSAGGDGGSAEISSALSLAVDLKAGMADLRSNGGKFGTLLLDPGAVDIVSDPTDDAVLTGGTIRDGSINAFLNGDTADLVISTANGTTGSQILTVTQNADVLWTTARKLTLVGTQGIIVSGTVTSTNSGGDLELRSDSTTIASNGGGTISGGALDIAGNLKFADATGGATGTAAIAPTAIVLATTIDSLGTINVGDDITTTDDQNYAAVIVSSSATLSSGGNIHGGNVTIADGATLTVLTTGSGSATFGNVLGTAGGTFSHLTVDIGGRLNIGTIGTDMGAVTVNQSNIATFNGSVDAATLSLSNITGRAQFIGALNITGAMSVGTGGYAVQIDSGGNVAGRTIFHNTGTTTITGTTTFVGGFDTSSGPSLTNISGAISTTNGAIDLGTTVLTGGATLNVGTSSVNTHSTLNGAFGLTITGNADLGDAPGDFIGNTAPLTSFSVSGTTAMHAGDSGNTTLHTNGPQTYTGTLSLGLGATLDTGGGSLHFGAINGLARDLILAAGTGGGTISFTGNIVNLGDGFGPALTVQAGATGPIHFTGNIGANSGLVVQGTNSVQIDADATFGGGNTATSIPGTLLLNSVTLRGGTGINLATVTLSGGTATTVSIISSDNKTISFNGPVNGSPALIAKSGGTITFAAPIGGGTMLASVLVNGIGTQLTGVGSNTENVVLGTVNLNANISTTGSQDFRSTAVLGAPTVTLTSTTGVVSFLDKMFGGGNNLVIAAPAVLGNGSTDSKNHTDDAFTGLGTLRVTGAATIGALSVLGSGTQSYLGAVRLGRSIQMGGGTLGPVAFSGTVDGDSFGSVSLTVTGDAVFGNGSGDFVGGTAILKTLRVTGATTFNTGTNATGSIRTSGVQEYTGPVTVAADTKLSAGNITPSVVTFGSTIDGPRGLDIGANADFSDVVGGTSAPAFLNVTNAATFHGVNSIRAANATFRGPVSMPGAVLSTGSQSGLIDFQSTLNVNSGNLVSQGTLTAVRFGGVINGLNELQMSGPTTIDGPGITSTGGQTYDGEVTLSGATTVTLNTSGVGVPVIFHGNINGLDKSLVIVHNTTIGIVPENSVALATLSIGEESTISGTITTSGDQRYHGPVTIEHASIFEGQTIHFNNTLDGAGQDLTINAGTAAFFGGDVGGVGRFNSITFGGGLQNPTNFTAYRDTGSVTGATATFAANSFTMNPELGLGVVGNLVIDVQDGQADLANVAASGKLTVIAGTVHMVAQGGGNQDLVSSLVAGTDLNVIRKENDGTHFPTLVPITLPSPLFVDDDSSVPGFNGEIGILQNGHSPSEIAAHIRSGGSRTLLNTGNVGNTDISLAVASAIPREDPLPVQDVALQNSDLVSLTDLDINARDFAETFGQEDGSRTVADFPSSLKASAGQYKIATSRLSRSIVYSVISIYRQTYYRLGTDAEGNVTFGEPRDAEISDALQQVMASYNDLYKTAEGPPTSVDPAIFRSMVLERGTDEAREYFANMEALFQEMENLGLGPREFDIAKTRLLNRTRGNQLTVQELYEAIRGGSTRRMF